MNSISTAISSQRSVLLVCVVILVISIAAAPIFTKCIAKSYTIESVAITAQLNTDGSMDIREERTYYFSGAFSYANYTLPVDRTGGVQDIRVSEISKVYRLDESGEAATYRVYQDNQKLEITWYYNARDEVKTFIIEYRIVDVITRYEDAAVLYHKFVGTGWDKSTSDVQVRIIPPAGLVKDDVRAWAHGPLHGSVYIHEMGEVTADVSPLPLHQYWEVRALYPPEFFQQAPLKAQAIRTQVFNEEKEWADEANRRRERALKHQAAMETQKKYGKWIALVVCVIGLAVWWRLYSNFGRRPSVQSQGATFSGIPSDLPPALLSYLLYNREVAGGALIGTLLDLARRKFVEIEEKIVERGRSKRKKTHYLLRLDRSAFNMNRNSLLPFEACLLTFIFDELAEGADEVDIKLFEKKRSKFSKFFTHWQKDVKDEGKARNYFNEKSVKAMYYSLGLAGLFFALTIVSAFFIAEWAILMAVTTIAIFICSFILLHRNADAEREARQWKGLKRYLRKYHFRTANSKDFLQYVDRYLVYGVVLLSNKKVFTALADLIPPEQYSAIVPWFVLYAGHGASHGPQSFGEALGSLMTTVSNTMSSAAGVGGGASVGGGGGTGGSGGGAG